MIHMVHLKWHSSAPNALHGVGFWDTLLSYVYRKRAFYSKTSYHIARPSGFKTYTSVGCCICFFYPETQLVFRVCLLVEVCFHRRLQNTQMQYKSKERSLISPRMFPAKKKVNRLLAKFTWQKVKSESEKSSPSSWTYFYSCFISFNWRCCWLASEMIKARRVDFRLKFGNSLCR